MLKRILYICWLILFAFCVVLCARSTNIKSFFDTIEYRTFDIRQSIKAKDVHTEPSSDIVIVTIDDATYEYILQNYGEWPIPRELYVKLIYFIEKQQPLSIAFDLMFVKSMKSTKNADDMLVKAVTDFDNVFVSMNFDNQPASLRDPQDLPDHISKNVINLSDDVDLNRQLFSNCRTILDGLMNGTKNIGMTNVQRSEDGVLRKIPAFLKYKGKYYPQLGLAVGIDYLKQKENLKDDKFVIDKNSNLIIGNRKIFLDKDGGMILNWYNNKNSYQYIPLYKILKMADGELPADSINFKNKIVYIGTSAVSLYDIKTVPVNKAFPGVEVQAICVNNMIDNNFIHKTGFWTNAIITAILCILIIIIVLSESSVVLGVITSISVYIIYSLITYYMMKFFNVWIDIVYPLSCATLMFTCAYIIKYLIKSRDFEKQYILATTDGLTELYNHRYFKEQLKLILETSKREGSHFSLIILDIDFFKKFNDTYGHQAGDAILKQVAQTIKKSVRASDIVFRYGGEEMSIILSNTDYDSALMVAEKIRSRIFSRNFVLPNNKTTNVTVSLGASTFPADGISSEELVESADKRLYKAKETGRNKVGK